MAYKRILTDIGPLRIMVSLLALATLPWAFIQEITRPPWDIIIGQITPGLVLFLLWAIPFDMIMAKVFMSDAESAEKARLYNIIKIDVMVWLLLLICWGFYFSTLLNQRLS